MHSLGDLFAVLVSADQFDLLDANGFVVASLLSGSDASAFPFSPLYTGLDMFHLDPATTDSSLRWTHPSASGNEYVQLAGPATVGAGSFRPRLLLFRNTPGPQARFLLGTGRPDGSGLSQAYIQGIYDATTAAARYLQLGMGSSGITIADDTGTVLGPAGSVSVGAAIGYLLLQAAQQINMLSNQRTLIQSDTDMIIEANRLLGAAQNIFIRPNFGTVIMDVSGLSVNGTLGFYPANPTISASSYTSFPGGLYVSGGTCYVQNRLNARENIANDTGGSVNFYRQQPVGHIWSDQQINVRDDQGGGNAQAGISFWCPLAGTAPILRSFGQFGDRLDCLNSGNSAYASLNASAFNVLSTERVKIELAELDDARVLELAAGARAHRFRAKVRPQTLRPTPRFERLAERWNAKHSDRPLTVTSRDHVEPHDHDCSIDSCAGTAEAPCPITANDTHRFGLIAEHLHELAPELTELDELGRPAEISVDQVASLALGAAGALVRRLAELDAELAELRARVIELERAA